MSVSSKIKALLKLKGKGNEELANHLDISKQSLSNKFYRDSFSTQDLIKISTFLGYTLAFVIDESQMIILDKSDLKGEGAK
ncbi:hypothetical protein Ccar_25870 (plasmid) [Clostridium carboxidivorans P7]|uniref:Bacteriophage CI repressor N-terminal domain-containing protein n=1 Tax=Clostridium carboxidivorans P7 TaxID=536227 RepID=C6PZZ3_9CLOT|nr:helix-turn-helix domain-containing protein [Clostridium carboxidivorans]ADO12122.1 hypothetical protein Ccar_4282 [Clostridium carboxidivorans P7]AKN34257.1 hypothetical protein Ccar_25870 [Clostridium carboxidivorans P7]EET85203.1 hypothetical protein CcarbDRAFT_4360 [Clostridium carboxidivorans P7]EFG87522.1 hypothetical protein CLCAR_3057 [Clostridium carboxidivorans P7]